jgi:hypothetical protein
LLTAVNQLLTDDDDDIIIIIIIIIVRRTRSFLTDYDYFIIFVIVDV